MGVAEFGPNSDYTIGTEYHYPINYYWSNKNATSSNQLINKNSARYEERFDVSVKTYKQTIGPFSRISDLFLVNEYQDSFKALTMLPAINGLIQAINMDYFSKIVDEGSLCIFNPDKYYAAITSTLSLSRDKELGHFSVLNSKQSDAAEPVVMEMRYLNYNSTFYNAVASSIFSDASINAKLTLGSSDNICLIDSSGQSLISSVSFTNTMMSGFKYAELNILPLEYSARNKYVKDDNSFGLTETFLSNPSDKSLNLTGPYALLKACLDDSCIQDGYITRLFVSIDPSTKLFLLSLLGLSSEADIAKAKDKLNVSISKMVSFKTYLKNNGTINRQQAGNDNFDSTQQFMSFTTKETSFNLVDAKESFYIDVVPVKVSIDSDLTEDGRLPLINITKDFDRKQFRELLGDSCVVIPRDCAVVKNVVKYDTLDLPRIIGKPMLFFCPYNIPYVTPKLLEFHGAENFCHDEESLSFLVPKWSKITSGELLVDMYCAAGIGFNDKMFAKAVMPEIV